MSLPRVPVGNATVSERRLPRTGRPSVENAQHSAIIRCPCGCAVRATVSVDGSAAYATCTTCGRTLRCDLRTGRVTVVRGEPYLGAGSE